jgi:hypothetical protein
MATETVLEAARLRGDEEAFLWATASLGHARREVNRRLAALLEAVVEELAFGLGAASFPPAPERHASVPGTTPARCAPRANAVFAEGRPYSLRRCASSQSP